MAARVLNIQLESARLARALQEYRRLSGYLPSFVLAKQGGKLAFALRRRLNTLMPAKGSIRSERLAILASGGGVKVRQSARDFATRKTRATAVDIRTRRDSDFREVTRSGNLKKDGRSWWQVAVARELSIRESGRGFLGVSAKYPQSFAALEKSATQIHAVSRYGPALSAAGIESNQSALTFTWDPSRSALQASAAAGLNKPKGRNAIALAMRDVSNDIAQYTARKTREIAQRSGLTP